MVDRRTLGVHPVRFTGSFGEQLVYGRFRRSGRVSPARDRRYPRGFPQPVHHDATPCAHPLHRWVHSTGRKVHRKACRSGEHRPRFAPAIAGTG
jgi:hypothetical protein